MLRLKRQMKDQAGFTLVEIAIVMVIIGLLIGGVLKGQAMIQNARVKNVVKQGDEFRAAWATFFDRYSVLPGDENLAAIPPQAADGEGNANGRVEGGEAFEVFRDLAIAQMIGGAYNGTTQLPRHSFGGNVDIIWFDPPGAPQAGHYLRYTGLPAEVCQEIDLKYDNGAQATGTIVGSAAYTAGTVIPFFYMLF